MLSTILTHAPKFVDQDKSSVGCKGLESMTKDDFELLSDLSVYHVQRFGIHDDEPNRYGLELKNILDKLNRI